MWKSITMCAGRNRLLLSAAGLVLLAGCAVAPPADPGTHYWDEVVSAWQGRDAIELWRSWGVPTKIVQAPNGHEMHVYVGSTTTRSVGSSFFESGGLSVGKSAVIVGCQTDFEVDSAKVIIGAIWRGEACPRSEAHERPKWLAAVPIGF